MVQPIHQTQPTDLFSPVNLGALHLANRIVMAPLTRSRVGADGVPNALLATYYAQRASAGLIIAEATNISAQGRGYDMTPGIWTDAQVEGWKNVTDAVHAAGGRIVCQLWHVGRFSHVSLQPDGAAPVAPSAIKAEGQTYTAQGMVDVSMPRALETAEIPGIIDQYQHAAECAKRAGFDGVEVHAANSYLLDQFLRDSTNIRDDAYGGSIIKRTRLVREVVEAVVAVWGSARVGIRLSPTTPDAGNTPIDSDVMATYGALITQLNKYGLAYLHMAEGATAAARDVPAGIDLDALRNLFNGHYIGNNAYDLNLAVARRAAHRVDAVAFGRPFIANPDLVERLRDGHALAVAPREAYYGGGAKGYTDWPRADGTERTERTQGTDPALQ
ncbi:alkene reductase [Alcaligenaceae bacterium B3P038]|nr:alkene reductase [Alcaligenaceae bacterium B3P038]